MGYSFSFFLKDMNKLTKRDQRFTVAKLIGKIIPNVQLMPQYFHSHCSGVYLLCGGECFTISRIVTRAAGKGVSTASPPARTKVLRRFG
jgi:hypothetical protein